MQINKRLIALVLATGTLLAGIVPGTIDAKQDPVFADGGDLVGSTNGMSFGPDGTLWVANVFGQTITQIDPDSGEILSRLTPADGVLFPDDLVVASNGDIYWTSIATNSVWKKPAGGAAFAIAGLNSANPIVLSDDESRLFAAGCYGAPPANNDVVEIDPINGGVINTLRSGVPGCASNGMSWNDGYLYAPQPFEDRILRIDQNTGDVTTATDGYAVPIGTAFDSHGDLYALAQGVGEVVRVDLSNPDTFNNRTVIAEIPFGWADNIAINAEDRIFISSASDSTVLEVLPGGALRTVVPGQFQMTLGVNVIGDTVYSTHSSGIVAYDRKSGVQTGHYRSPFGVGNFPFTLSTSRWGDDLVLMSIFDGGIHLWDPVANVPLASGLLPGPVDAEPFGDGLLVTTIGGDIFLVDDQLVPTGVVASIPGVTGVAVDGDDVYVSNHTNGTVLQIIAEGETLAAPLVVADGLAGPEGLDVSHNWLYVVEGASGTVTRTHLESGKRTTVGSGLGFQLPVFFPFGLFNDVTVDHNDVYVNAEGDNVVYRF